MVAGAGNMDKNA
jgi:hypothetical protein